MNNLVALFINGLPPKEFPDFNNFNKVYCTDGAYNYLKKEKLVPHVLSGDFDSLTIKNIPSTIKVIHTPDQNYTDFEKALQLISKDGFKYVSVYGANGLASDHFLGNLSAALRFNHKLDITFYDDFSVYFFAKKETIIKAKIGQKISLYPFPKAERITTNGLEYPLKNEDLSIKKRIGTRNVAIQEKINVTFKKGNLLIFLEQPKLH